MKKKVLTILVWLSLVLLSNSLWAYSVSTIGEQIGVAKASIEATKASIAEGMRQQSGLISEIQGHVSSLSDINAQLQSARQAVVDYKAQVLASQGNPALVKAANEGLRLSNGVSRDLLSQKQGINKLIQADRDQIGAIVALTGNYKVQLIDLNKNLQYLRDVAAKCGVSSISLC